MAKVSVLIPSRGRPEHLKKSIESWGEGDLEFVIGTDADDPQVEVYENEFGTIGKFTTMRFSPRPGYDYLDEYFNTLAELAYGDWLVLWNDDIEWASPTAWHQLLEYDHTQPLIIKLNPIGVAVAMSRKCYEIMGHFSTGMSNDGYLMDLGERCGILKEFEDDYIMHWRDRIDDQTSQDKNAAIEGWDTADGRALTAEEMQQTFVDEERIKAWLAK